MISNHDDTHFQFSRQLSSIDLAVSECVSGLAALIQCVATKRVVLRKGNGIECNFTHSLFFEKRLKRVHFQPKDTGKSGGCGPVY